MEEFKNFVSYINTSGNENCFITCDFNAHFTGCSEGFFNDVILYFKCLILTVYRLVNCRMCADFIVFF